MSGRPVPSQLDQVLPQFYVQKAGPYHPFGKIRIAPFGKGGLRILAESGYSSESMTAAGDGGGAHQRQSRDQGIPAGSIRSAAPHIRFATATNTPTGLGDKSGREPDLRRVKKLVPKSSSLLRRENSLFFENNSLLWLQKFPVRLRREFVCKPLNRMRRLDAKITAEGRNLQNSLLFSLLAGKSRAETGSQRTASSASQSLFLRGFMVLTPNAREHGACARGGSVSVSQSRAGSSRFGALSLRANFGVSFLAALR